ncbi:MAG: helix-turn-helix transcriptional regulator [Pseudonocardiales bacterium]|nr:helix-turn-helix transcriptional regulator [Pseudonocardiales bacterium]
MFSVDMEEASAIGARARMIRRRRGLSLEVVAGLAGITKQYLSALELGQRGFNRRGLIEDLANALGCSVADLTGQPYPALDRATKDALATLPSIRLVLNDFGPTDVPDVTPRPLEALASLADEANEHCGQAHYSLARHDIGSLLAESQTSALTVPAARRDQAFTAAVTTCFVAGVVSSRAGNVDLAATAALRGYDLAQQHDNPALLGFARWYWALELTSMAARTRAHAVLSDGINDLAPAVQLSAANTLAAEIVGMMHLQQARTAARRQDADNAHAHLDEAAHIASRVGERNGMRQHFGPTNVAAWRVSVGVELAEGAKVYEDVTAAPTDIAALGSRERSSSLHFDLARVLAQEDGPRDADVIRHLDTADRIAPQRIRSDPIARDLVLTLDRRAERRVWELDSLLNRFGIGGHGQRSVDN